MDPKPMVIGCAVMSLFYIGGASMSSFGWYAGLDSSPGIPENG